MCRTRDAPDRGGSRGRARRLLATGCDALAALAVASGSVLAHSGHEGADGGGVGIVLPAALLFGSAVVIGTSTYLERNGGVDGRLARAGVLLGVVGLFVGALLALL